MSSHSLTCPRCGTVNRLYVQGDILPMEEIRCSKCHEALGTWGALTGNVVADTKESSSSRQPPH